MECKTIKSAILFESTYLILGCGSEGLKVYDMNMKLVTDLNEHFSDEIKVYKDKLYILDIDKGLFKY